jgi:hypothetical protein
MSTFNGFTRGWNDNDYIDQRTMQNTNGSNYLFQNYFAQDTTMKKPIHFALMQPNVFYKGSNGIGQNGYNIDENSQLTIGSLQTQSRNRIDLVQRPFVTVPYLGRGTVDPVMESQILQGEIYTNKKSYNQLSEVSYLPLSNTPLIPSIKNTITNPTYLVEDNSGEWVRGGVPSREVMRDN